MAYSDRIQQLRLWLSSGPVVERGSEFVRDDTLSVGLSRNQFASVLG
jgi:hypothetical protein